MSSFSRYLYYFKKYKVSQIVKLSILRVWRKVFDNRVVVFTIDLNEIVDNSELLKNDIVVENIAKFQDIDTNDISKIYKIKGSEQVVDNFFKKFFKLGATLWLTRRDDCLVGYHWTIVKGFHGFYNMPMTSSDCVLAASEIFPEYRGEGLNVKMINSILGKIKELNISRVFIGAGIWNRAQLNSLKKTHFQKVGIVRKYRLFNSYVTIWKLEKD